MTEQQAAAPQAKQQKTKEPPEISEATKKAIKLCREANQLFDKDLPAAVERYREAIAADSEHIEGHFNLGIALRELERDDEAIAAFLSVTEKQELAPKAYNNLGLLHARNSRWDKAEEHFRMAIDQHFQDASAHFNLGMFLCRLGRFKEGFKECEWRWQTSDFNPIRCLQPRWTGQETEGTLLVHTEQGIGDTIQFMRFLPEIKKRCKKIILFCPENLHCLIDKSKGVDDLRSPGNLQLDEFQFYLPLMSAPYALGTELDTIPASVPYLFPVERELNLGECHVPQAKLRVGISWGGSVTHSNDKHRSCELEHFKPLLDIPEIAFYSLQKGPQTEDLGKLPDDHRTRVRDVADLQADMADAAAIVKQLDLVISVDTAVLHLAGALGEPAWGLLCAFADWRWLQDRDDSPWYPTLRLFRQQTLDDWPELMSRVAEALREEVAKRG